MIAYPFVQLLVVFAAIDAIIEILHRRVYEAGEYTIEWNIFNALINNFVA